MPKRTNEFQKLVFLVKKHVASGATVTESKFLRDRITGAKREVDICIESSVAGHSVTVSIECNDQGRKTNVKWIEEMKAKHERLSTNALILISSSGFTKEAQRVAKSYGIEVITLSALNTAKAERLFGVTSSLWSKTFTLSPTKVVMYVPQVGDLAEEYLVMFPDNIVYNHKEQEIFTVKELVEIILHGKKVVEQFYKAGNESHKGFDIRWERVRDMEGNPLFLRKIDPYVLRPIGFVQITGSCSFEISEFPLKHGSLGEVKIAWSTGKF